MGTGIQRKFDVIRDVDFGCLYAIDRQRNDGVWAEESEGGKYAGLELEMSVVSGVYEILKGSLKGVLVGKAAICNILLYLLEAC